MGKCSRCGKHGLFLKVSTNGLCKNCAEEIAAQQAQARKDKEAAKEKKRAEMAAAFDALPSAEIARDGVKHKIQPTAFLDGLKYSRPTTKSKSTAFQNFVVLDTETTGLSALKNDVVEIAALRVQNFEFVETFHTMVRPAKGLTEDGIKVNGITADMLDGAPLLYEVIPSLQAFIGDWPLLGQNLAFDLKFLCRAGLDVTPETRKFFDTLELAKLFLKKPKVKWDKEYEMYLPDLCGEYDVENYKLETLCDYYGIERFESHRALGDCVDTARVFRSLLEEKISTT